MVSLFSQFSKEYFRNTFIDFNKKRNGCESLKPQIVVSSINKFEKNLHLIFNARTEMLLQA